MSERRNNEKVDLFSFAMCLVELIDRHYPQDQAHGFREGDLRGAFTLSRALPR